MGAACYAIFGIIITSHDNVLVIEKRSFASIFCRSFFFVNEMNTSPDCVVTDWGLGYMMLHHSPEV